MQAPNRLGSVLGYLGSAYRYASEKAAPIQVRRSPVYTVLDRLARSSQYGSQETMDVAAAMRLAITSAWFYSGTKLIADRVASAEARPRIARRIDSEIRDEANHEFDQLLQRPNSLMTTEYILRYLTFWAYLAGNAYLFISTPAPGRGTPEELWPLPASMITPIPTSLRTSRLTGQPCIDYAYKISDTLVTLPGENIVHFRFPNPFDYWRGLSPLTAMMGALQTDFYQSRYLRTFYGEDNAVPTAIISLPTETNDVDFEIAKEQIREQFGKERRSAITRAGELSVEVITTSIAHMDLVNTRRFNREEINHVLGIPEGLITGGASGDSRLATEISFTRNTVQPFLDLLAAEMTANIAPYYGKEYVIRAPIIIPQDRALKVQEYTIYSQDRTVNENRKELGLPPIMEDNLPPEMVTLVQMCSLPVRLLAYAQSNTFASDSYLPDGSQALAAPDMPDMSGTLNPGHGLDTAATKAALLGQRDELKRWRKVALREARDGRDPGARQFSSDVLDLPMKTSLELMLRDANEEKIREVFDVYTMILELEAA